MSQLPPLELLDSTHQFPCHYTLKIVGSPADAFLEKVKEVFLKSSSHRISVRMTSKKKHASVTVDVWVSSSTEVHFWYEEALKIDGLVLII